MWIKDECKYVDFGDKRLNDRYGKVLNSLANNSDKSPSASVTKHDEMIGMFRFFNNDKVSIEKIMGSHSLATIERMESEESVLLIQDTSSIDLTHKKFADKLGHLESSKRRGIFLHPSYAVNEEGLPLGISMNQVYTRDPKTIGKAKKRNNIPFEKKESYRWYNGYMHAVQVSNLFPDKEIISVADRECDIYELLSEATKESNKAFFVTRVGQNRRTLNEDNDVVLIRDNIEQMAIKGNFEVTIPKTNTRKKREATLEVKYEQLELVVPYDKRKQYNNTKINVLSFKEIDTKPEIEAIEWVIFTTLPVTNLNEAKRVLNIYKLRWKIEIYFRTLKTGCKIEKLQLETEERFLNALAIYSIIAWRIMYLTEASRTKPEDKAVSYMDKVEVNVIARVPKKKIKPEQLGMREAIRILGTFGGFKGRKCDGEPGPKYIWEGLKALHNYLYISSVLEK